jgi:hypothetical protein
MEAPLTKNGITDGELLKNKASDEVFIIDLMGKEKFINNHNSDAVRNWKNAWQKSILIKLLWLTNEWFGIQSSGIEC